MGKRSAVFWHRSNWYCGSRRIMYIEYMYQNILERHLRLGEQRTFSNLEAKEYLIYSGNAKYELRPCRHLQHSRSCSDCELIKYLNIILSYNIMQLGILQTHNKYESVQNLHISTCNYASQREAFDHFAFASKFS